MRILFLNHTGQCGGAEGLLLRLIATLNGETELAVACPAGGPLAESLSELDVQLFPIAGTTLNLQLAARQTVVGTAELLGSAVAVHRAVRRFRPAVVHANTLRGGLIAALPRVLGKAPLLVQSHEHLGPGGASRATRELLSRTADHVIAVTDATARDFNAGLARPVAERLYPGIDQSWFRPSSQSREEILGRLPFEAGGPLLGQLAQITPWKGQDVTIQAFARVRERFPDAHLLLIGSILFERSHSDNRSFLESLKLLVAELGVDDSVHFLGRRDDVLDLLRVLDLHLLPSWDEPFGGASAEAMATGTVPMITAVGGACEYVEDGVCGRVLPPHEPEPWARAAIALLEDRDQLDAMADRAREVGARFTMEAYARELRMHWEKAIARARADRMLARLFHTARSPF
jgi:glycosyltransferase involved in cell wall biosynthesis